MLTDPAKIAEYQDAINHLREEGYGKLVDLLLNSDCCFHQKRGRLNVSEVARRLKIGSAAAQKMLDECRSLLEEPSEGGESN